MNHKPHAKTILTTPLLAAVSTSHINQLARCSGLDALLGFPQALWCAGLLFQKNIENFAKKTATKVFLISIGFVVWKVLSTNWIVSIPTSDGRSIRLFTKASPLWIRPEPRSPFSSFEQQVTADYGSGNGPSVTVGTARVSPNWLLISAQLVVLVTFSTAYFTAEALHDSKVLDHWMK